jgi:hypothetical protein
MSKMLSILVSKQTDLQNLPTNIDFFIIFENGFNQVVVIPERTKELRLNSVYNIKLNFPEGITHLKLGEGYNHKLELPNSIRYLEISRGYKHQLDNLPMGLTHLKFSGDFRYKKFPTTLTHLELGSNSSGCLNNLPNGLEKLIIGNYFFGNVNNLPCGLKLIKCSRFLKIDKIPFNCELVIS